MTASGVWSDAVRLAVGTLTTVKVPPPSTVDRRRAGRAMALAPLAGCVPGAAAGASAALGLALGWADPLCAAAALAASALTTRGLHLDGLADTADGLAAAYDRERALSVMRRGNSGPAGVAALVLTLLLQVTALTQALVGFGPVAVAVAVAAGRVALPVACRKGVPAARPEGLGAAVAGSVPVPVVGLVVAACTLGAAASTWLLATGDVARPAVAGAAAVVAAALAGGLLLRRCRSRFGGVTGDVLGACVEVATTAAALLLAALA